jgi:5-methylcytosine-specific restriction endonuclease McrA
MNFAHLSSHALTAKLGELLADERQTIVAFVLHLAELERRQLHLELGYPNLYGFCIDRLKLTRGATYRRVTAARLVARYPEIAEYLRDGRLCLTTLALLDDVLDDSNVREVLERAAGRTEEQTKVLVAALKPQPAPRDLFQRLPAPRAAAQCAAALTAASCPAPAVPAAEAGALIAPPANAPEAQVATALQANFASPVPARRAAAAPQPISADQYVLRVTIGQELADDLKKVKALLSHSIPDGNLEAVLHACVRNMIAHCEKRRMGSDEPRPRKVKQPPKDRGVPVEVSREIWKRDGGTCAYLAPDGKRCGSDYQVEVHHLQPYARKGPPTVENLQIRCRAHNRYAAEKDFGSDFMARFGRRAPRRLSTADERGTLVAGRDA